MPTAPHTRPKYSFTEEPMKRFTQRLIVLLSGPFDLLSRLRPVHRAAERLGGLRRHHLLQRDRRRLAGAAHCAVLRASPRIRRADHRHRRGHRLGDYAVRLRAADGHAKKEPITQAQHALSSPLRHEGNFFIPCAAACCSSIQNRHAAERFT